jgi:hypothetical protein
MTESEIQLLQQENTRLKNELKEAREKEKGIHEDYKKQLSGARRDRSLTLLLASFKTKFDDLPADVKDSALHEIINNSLAADNAELALGDSGQLVLRRKDGSNYFGEDHRLFTPNTYLEKVMDRQKILKSAEQQQVVQNTARANNNTGNSWAERKISSLVDESLEVFKEQNVF